MKMEYKSAVHLDAVEEWKYYYFHFRLAKQVVLLL